jgi:hypothetical protein
LASTGGAPWERSRIFTAIGEHRGDVGELAGEHGHDPVELFVDSPGVGLSEDRADGGGDHLSVGSGHPGQHVAHEMGTTPLPGGAEHDGGDGFL